MYAEIDKYIDGFELFPLYEENDDEKVLKALRVSYLEKGRELVKELIEGVDEVQVERIQNYLLERVIVNLNLVDHVMETEKLSRKRKTIGVANMFRIDVTNQEENKDGPFDITVVFIKNGFWFTETNFKAVPKEVVEEIREFLSDSMKYNLTCDTQCRALSILDIIAVMDAKISRA